MVRGKAYVKHLWNSLWPHQALCRLSSMQAKALPSICWEQRCGLSQPQPKQLAAMQYWNKSRLWGGDRHVIFTLVRTRSFTSLREPMKCTAGTSAALFRLEHVLSFREEFHTAFVIAG